MSGGDNPQTVLVFPLLLHFNPWCISKKKKQTQEEKMPKGKRGYSNASQVLRCAIMPR